MKILIVTEYFPKLDGTEITGGVEASSFYISKYLSKKNRVTVISSYQKGKKRFEKKGNLEVHRVGKENPYSNEGNLISRLNFAIAAFNFGKNLSGDVVIGYNFISYLPAYAIAKKIKAKPIAVYHECWLGEWVKNKGLITGILGNLWERCALFLKWDKIISVSKFTSEKLKKYTNSKIVVVPNGIDLSEGCKNVKKVKNSLIAVGRLTPQKRISDLIDASSIIKKEIPDLKVTVIGAGVEFDNLKKKAGDYVEFLGYVKDRHKILTEISKSSILIAPSIVEGFGIVLLEAMACKTPYVCSDIPAFVEITKNGRGGLIFKKKDAKDLANKVIKLLKDKKLYARKVKECSLVNDYDWNKIAKRFEEELK